ncbi:MAG: endolytic transglycosylase MltG [Selenomonadaceae bacterium]|nr:endolytic transglycosylase MltG [Selenomonadaceae bacterium]
MKFPFFNSGKKSDGKVKNISSLGSRVEKKREERAKIISAVVNNLLAPFRWIKSALAEISWKYILSVVGGVIFCIAVVGAVLIFVDPSSIKPTQELKPKVVDDSAENHVHVKIAEGMTTAEIADVLEEKEVISSSWKFRIVSRLRGYEGQLKPGTYIFSADMNDEDVFAKLLTGEKYLVHFTIPEGFGVKEIAERLYSLDLVDKEDFLKAAEDFAPYGYMRKHKNVRYAAEGFLFPETYSVESDMPIEEILKMMAGEFDKRITPKMRERAKELGLSLYDLTTLASLVEREVRYPEDRAIVAQVFLKRLKLNMPLQTDATLQYLLDEPKEDVTLKDTEIDSPYNTYKNVGLPPGPIANPGMESFDAVLNPANTDYLYFVADRQGHNHYSYTYDEHLVLVNQYR